MIFLQGAMGFGILISQILCALVFIGIPLLALIFSAFKKNENGKPQNELSPKQKFKNNSVPALASLFYSCFTIVLIIIILFIAPMIWNPTFD